MSPARQNIWFIVVGVVLLAALVGARVTGGLGERSAEQATPSLPEQGADIGGPDGGGVLDGTDGRTATGAGGADADLESDFEAVPMALIYQLIDQLQRAGIPPAMPAEVVVEYVDGYETIEMRGEFENTSATEARFEWRDGTWYLVEPSGAE